MEIAESARYPGDSVVAIRPDDPFILDSVKREGKISTKRNSKNPFLWRLGKARIEVAPINTARRGTIMTNSSIAVGLIGESATTESAREKVSPTSLL